jgi:TRAP-type C4-dicarboxylate transport system permease small subunit
LHGVDALIARFAGVDVVDAIVYLPAILVPLAFVLAYGAGSAVFRSRAGGLALVAAQAAQVGFSRRDAFFEGTGLFETLSQPQAASRLLLAPAMIALAFAFIVEGGWILLASLGAAAFALSAVHPTYAPYVALVFGGFLLARMLLIRGWERLLTRGALVLGAILVPFGLVLILLFPVVRGTRVVAPSAGDRVAELHRNSSNFTSLGDWFGYSPSAIAREGPVVVAGLLAVPLAGFAARRLWAALVLGGSLAVLTVLLAPPLFTALSDAFSVSQSRRLAGFLPIAFAVTGGCVVVARLRALGVALAAGAGVALVLLYPGEFTRRVEEGGPEWTVAVAVAGGLVALVAGVLLRPRGPSAGVWTVAVALAFVVPVAVAGFSAVQRVGMMSELTPGIITAVRAQTAPGDVVFSDLNTAFEIAGFAPVYINAAPLGNVADTTKNRPRLRAADSRRFFNRRSLTDAGRRAILDRYGAGWVLVDKERTRPDDFLRTLRIVFQDGRYVLYRVTR